MVCTFLPVNSGKSLKLQSSQKVALSLAESRSLLQKSDLLELATVVASKSFLLQLPALNPRPLEGI